MMAIGKALRNSMEHSSGGVSATPLPDENRNAKQKHYESVEYGSCAAAIECKYGKDKRNQFNWTQSWDGPTIGGVGSDETGCQRAESVRDDCRHRAQADDEIVKGGEAGWPSNLRKDEQRGQDGRNHDADGRHSLRR